MKVAGAAIRRFLAKPEQDVRAVLLYGPNEGFVHEAAETLVRHAVAGSDDPYAVTRLGEDEIKRDSVRLADALAAQSLLGGPTVVWAKINGRSADDALLHALAGVERKEPGGYLVVEAGDLGGSAEVVKKFAAAQRAAAIAFYEETETERAAFARGLLLENKLSLSGDAESALLAALPPDRGTVRQEIEKLTLFAHGMDRAVSLEDVAALGIDECEGALDAASLAVAQGRSAQAAEALSRVEALSGVSALRALLRRMNQLREVRVLIDDGMSASDAVAKLRPPVFWKERDPLIAVARLWTAKKLSVAYDLLWSAELRAKTAAAPQHLIAAETYRAVARLAG